MGHLFRLRLFLLPLLLASGLAFAEPVVVERDSPLLAEPRNDARVIANVKRGSSADATVRKGAWVTVKTAAGSGWMLAFNLRYGSAPTAESSTAGLSGLASRLTGTQKPGVTPVIGVRGFEVEDLKQARMNAGELKQMERYRTTDAQARSAAASSGLRAGNVDYVR